MPKRECPYCSLPLIPGRYDDDPPHCPTCGPIEATTRSPGRRRRDDDDYEYERPSRRGRRDYDEDEYGPRRRYRDDYDRRIRNEGVPWYCTMLGAFLLIAGGLALLGNGAIFCIGFHEEFITNAKPDPTGVVLLALFAVAILAAVVTCVGGYCFVVGRHWGLAITGSVAVVFATHFFLLGLPLGIAAFIIMLQAEVKEAFR